MPGWTRPSRCWTRPGWTRTRWALRATSDLEGDEFAPCRADLLAALAGMGVDDALQEELSARLEAVEAELAEDA